MCLMQAWMRGRLDADIQAISIALHPPDAALKPCSPCCSLCSTRRHPHRAFAHIDTSRRRKLRAGAWEPMASCQVPA